MGARSRIECELAELAKAGDSENGILELDFDGPDSLLGALKGPIGTPYEGGTFLINIHTPPEYPFRPPTVRFVTKIWHPSICPKNGTICGNFLKHWTGAMTIKSLIQSVQTLLSSVRTTTKFDSNRESKFVAAQFVNDPCFFNLTARCWAHVCAKGPIASQEMQEMMNRVMQLVEMGFDEAEALDTLTRSDWIVERAAAELLNLSTCS